MKIKHIVLASTLLVSAATFAQKDELKALKKIYAKQTPSANDMAEYKTNVTKLETIAVEEGDKIYTNFYKCMLPLVQVASYGPTVTPPQMMDAFNPKAITDLANGLNATLEYEKKTGKKIYTDDINKTIASFKPQFVDMAVMLGNAKKFNEAADVLYAVYLMDKKDQEKLFYAASYAVNGQDYDKALDYYYQLKALNYSGEKTIYWATNKASNKEESFPTKIDRDFYVKAGSHTKPRDEKTESVRGEIYKNIALILVSQDKPNEAIAAVQEAEKENPNDHSLILTEAELHLKLKDYDSYTRCVNAALAKDPNNVDLLFNLGVISANSGKLEEATKYYKRVLEINPDYVNANINLAELILRNDEKMVKEMNSLGMSEKDNKRYA
ncbi:MAG: tetratricopeptide repeat protein, partial [Flavobacterium sp.]